MDKEELALCDRLWKLTKENELEWTIVPGEKFETEVDGMNLVLWLSPFTRVLDGSVCYTAYLDVKDGEEFFRLKEGWKGWRRIFQYHPLALTAHFCRREAEKIRATEKAQQKVTKGRLLDKLFSVIAKR